MANLRPALEQGCRKKTPSASIVFFVRIWYVFILSKCRGELDLGLCMSLVPAKRMPLHSADLRFQNAFGRKIRRKSALRSRILFACTKLMHRPTSDSFLHFDIKITHQIRKNSMLALGVCFPQSCSSDGRRFAASR